MIGVDSALDQPNSENRWKISRHFIWTSIAGHSSCRDGSIQQATRLPCAQCRLPSDEIHRSFTWESPVARKPTTLKNYSRRAIFGVYIVLPHVATARTRNPKITECFRSKCRGKWIANGLVVRGGRFGWVSPLKRVLVRERGSSPAGITWLAGNTHRNR